MTFLKAYFFLIRLGSFYVEGNELQAANTVSGARWRLFLQSMSLLSNISRIFVIKSLKQIFRNFCYILG